MTMSRINHFARIFFPYAQLYDTVWALSTYQFTLRY